jgi:PIN domain nuclease of toxin-antitoxin system
MNYLLDTHAFIWLSNEPDTLSKQAKEIIENKENKLLLSMASLWEMQIKTQLGKLELKPDMKHFVERELMQNEITILGIELSHIWEMNSLPFHHKDPFDRAIIAQARVEMLTILGKDEKIQMYDVKMAW